MAPSFSTWIETLVSVLIHPEVSIDTRTLLQNKYIFPVLELHRDADISVPVNLEVEGIRYRHPGLHAGVTSFDIPPMPLIQDQDSLPTNPSSTVTMAQKLRLQGDMRQGLSQLFM